MSGQFLESNFTVPRLVPVSHDRRTFPSESARGVQLLCGPVPALHGMTTPDSPTALKLVLTVADRATLAGSSAEAAADLRDEIEAAADAEMENTPEAEALAQAQEVVANVRAALPGARAGIQEAKARVAHALRSGKPAPRTAVPDAERFLEDTVKQLELHQAELKRAQANYAFRRAQVRGPLVAARQAELTARRAVLVKRAEAAALELAREFCAIVDAEEALKPE